MDNLLSYCLKLTHNRADAEDLAQDTRVRAWLNRAKFDGRHLDAWHRKIAFRLYLTAKTKRRVEISPQEPGYSPPDPVEAQELAARVESLPDPFRQTVELRALGHSYIEIAKILDVPEGTVMSRLHRAKERLCAT